MKRSYLFVIGVLLITILFSSGVFASSYAEHFSTRTSALWIDSTILGYRTKTMGTDGSTLLTAPQPSSQFYEKYFGWTDVKWSNGGAVVKFSPEIEVSTQLPARSYWMGAFSQYNASAGDQVRLRGRSGGPRDDTAVGFWTYY